MFPGCHISSNLIWVSAASVTTGPPGKVRSVMKNAHMRSTLTLRGRMIASIICVSPAAASDGAGAAAAGSSDPRVLAGVGGGVGLLVGGKAVGVGGSGAFDCTAVGAAVGRMGTVDGAAEPDLVAAAAGGAVAGGGAVNCGSLGIAGCVGWHAAAVNTKMHARDVSRETLFRLA